MTTDEIMEQAQVFASTYSLVGGRFDDGTKFAQSEDEKAVLREMISSALTAAPASAVEPVAWIPLVRWNELNKPGGHVAIQTLVHRDEPRKPEQYFPLYAGPEVTP